jgi:hypothetical protein
MNPIHFVIVAGNPIDGLSLYGNFKTAIEASEAASHDKTMPPEWWIAPVYSMGEVNENR